MFFSCSSILLATVALTLPRAQAQDKVFAIDVESDLNVFNAKVNADGFVRSSVTGEGDTGVGPVITGFIVSAVL